MRSREAWKASQPYIPLGLRLVHPRQIIEAVNRRLQAGTVTQGIREQMGKAIAEDNLLFKNVDVSQMNTVLRLKRTRKLETVSASEDSPVDN